MKVESIEIKNFKAIQKENIEINGNNVYVLGRNGMGKTSFLDAIFKTISGKDMPSKVVKEGEKNGFINIDMGYFIIKAVFNEKNEKVSMSIESKEGATYKSPRTMLDELAGVVDFNIENFFLMAPKKQVEFIKGLINLDFTDLDEDYNKFYSERTFLNRKVKELEAQQKPFEKDQKEVDLQILQADLSEKRLHNEKINDVKKRIDERKISITDLEKRIKDLEAEILTLEDKNEKANEFLALPENALNDIEALETEFNATIEKNKEAKEHIKNEALYESMKVAIKDQEAVEEKIKEIQETKIRLISNSEMPVPGLSFNEDGLTYNGLPFEASQINKAQQIIIGLQINLALLKDIKIARFDGSLIDNENMEYIEDWAKKNDMQLFVEFVDRSAENLKIEIRENV